MRPTGIRIAIPSLAALAILCGARAAAAQDTSWELKVVQPKPRPGPAPAEGEDAPEPEPAGPPMLRAILNGRVGLTAKDFILKQPDAPQPLAIKASKSVNYPDSDEPMAMVILVQGNFRWLGNETYTDPSDPEAGSIYDGAFKGLGPAIDILVKAGPPDSQAALMVYTEGKVLVKQAMGDAASLSGSALGSQQDYSEYISKPLVLGLGEAWKTLANMPDHRKILVVFGDGQDDKEDISAELKKVVSDLKTSGVEVYSVFYSAMPDDGPQGQQNMAKVGYTENLTATSRDNFASLADNIVEIIGAKYYVDFPGEEVAWDGLEHEFVLAVGGEDRDPKMLTLPVFEQQ
ncbi:MAG TPA: vWA domain-containing protein, partial [Kofleriaceae bacterium]|nr:vWA domain-containing protein [Kofleriaceae bacterium]